MTTKFTPGPWKIEYNNSDESSGGQWWEVGPAKVEFWYNATKGEYDEAEANARLIAAAPEMYELLKEIYSLPHFRLHDNISSLLNRIDHEL